MSPARQLWIGGALGAPPEIPPDDFVRMGESSRETATGERYKDNGYLLVSGSLLNSCPWGTWQTLADRRARLAVARAGDNRLVVRLDDVGQHVAGKMPGWISETQTVRDFKQLGLVVGRHPARWEQEGTVWVLAIYPRIIQPS